MINSRSTKAEILAHATELQARLDNGPDWCQIRVKVKEAFTSCRREVFLLIRDTYNAGVALRRLTDLIVAELSQPIFKA